MKTRTPLHFVSLLALAAAGFCFCWPAAKLLAQARKQPGGQVRGQGVRKPAAGAANAGSEPRVALVIGNGAYADGALANSANDARDMATALRQLGFDVSSGENLDRRQMEEKIRDFGKKIRGGGVGMFYYAGHGAQVGGANYLIPIGAQINGEAEVKYEAVDVGFVLAQMEEARNRLNIVVLDACRNNPFARSFRSASNGLASIDAPVGTLIAYATAPGRTASDGNARNGLYTHELLAAMRLPGLKIEDVFKRVRSEVRRQSNDQQVPWESSSIEGDFYFSTSGARPSETPDTTVHVTPGESQSGIHSVSGGVLQGKAIKKVQPSYPPIARAAKASGDVQVQVTISEAGQVVEAAIVSGHPLLRDAVLQAARQWTFQPTELAGVPVKVQGILTFNFSLK
jgi:TonB family protein